MHEVGLLGKYIPDFGKLTCLVQHEFYHQYTADEHTLMCLERLDDIWDAKDEPHSPYHTLFQRVERPYLLYLGLLLHDTGKPEGHGNHSEVSSEQAQRVARRLGLDGAATHTLRLLILHHLLMASTSQRRDLDDPAVIRKFAQQVQNAETVMLLTLHTYVDSIATSDKLWNGFKDSLLWSLHFKTMRMMTGGVEFVRAEERQRELLMEEVRRLTAGRASLPTAIVESDTANPGSPKEIAPDELQAHFDCLPARYFQIHSASEVLDDLALAHEFMWRQISEEESALTPVIQWADYPDRACSAVTVCTWDRSGLFRKIAGSLSAAGLNILSAQIFTRTDGIVLDTLFAIDARTGNLAAAEEREAFNKVLAKALTGEELDFHALIARQKISRPAYQAYTGEQLPTRIEFDNESSDTRTLLEVEAEDRVGLLYTISQTLAELDVDIAAAKINTERGAAIDSFYVSEVTGRKITSAERQQEIERKLRRAIKELEKR
jgi:[protein-PII] uridylyltransferase